MPWNFCQQKLNKYKIGQPYLILIFESLWL